MKLKEHRYPFSDLNRFVRINFLRERSGECTSPTRKNLLRERSKEGEPSTRKNLLRAKSLPSFKDSCDASYTE